jgi:predicted esterase
MQRSLTIAALFVFGFAATASEVVRLDWPTSHASPSPKFSQEAASVLPAFRVVLSTVQEATIVTFALSQPAMLGLTKAQADMLTPLVAARYRILATSSIYSNTPTLLPYCYQTTRPTNGLASLYIPNGASPDSPVIVFLHGFGGSFFWYQHWLSESFPEHIILCPAYGISAATISSAYVSEAMAAASMRLGFKLNRPSLLGLSAGGVGACRVFTVDSAKFSRLICLGTLPPEETLQRFPKNGVVRFLSGSNEPFVVSGQLARSVQSIKRTGPDTDTQIVPNADHFFLLTHPMQTIESMRKWLLDQPKRKTPL